MIDWNKATKRDVLRINKLAKRAAAELGVDLLSTQMDLEACHTNECALDLEAMLSAGRADFAHDVLGIARHLDRDTGKLRDCFFPRFACAVPQPTGVAFADPTCP